MIIESSKELLSHATRAKLRCPHLRGRYVGPSEGDHKLMVVGEAPGAEEEEAYAPFVGQAGRTLRAALAACELPDPYITNAVKYRPKTDSGEGNRPPEWIELMAFRPLLLAEINLVRPRCLLCLGGSAAKALSAKEELRVSHYVGKRVTVALSEHKLEVPCIITWHPSYVNHNGGVGSRAYYEFLESVKEAKRIAYL